MWIWKGLVPNSGSALLFAEPKTGKSYVALGLAEAVADPTTREFLGQPIDQHGPVLYIQLDTPRELWRTNYVAQTRDIPHLYFIDREMPELPPEFDIRNASHAEWLAAEVESVQPILVVVDTLRNVHMGDENDSLVMRFVWEGLMRAIKPAATLILSHQRKPGAAGDSGSLVSTARGSSALTGAVDAILQMTKKRIKVSARSDVERLNVYQQDNGFFSAHPGLDIRPFLATLDPSLPERKKDELIAAHFDISDTTARRYRLRSLKDE